MIAGTLNIRQISSILFFFCNTKPFNFLKLEKHTHTKILPQAHLELDADFFFHYVIYSWVPPIPKSEIFVLLDR